MVLNKKVGWLFFGLFLLFSMPLILADNTVTLETPAASAGITGTYVLNATVDTNSLNLTNATFYYKITGGSWILIASVKNQSGLSFNYTWVSTGIVDAENAVFNVTIQNESTGKGVITEDTSTGVDVDNGFPTATLSSSSLADNAKVTISSGVFDFSIDADSTIGITNCTFWIGSSSLNIDSSGNACSDSVLTTNNFSGLSAGYYDYLITATDNNANKTNSSTRTIELVAQGGGGGKYLYVEGIAEDIISDVTVPSKNIFLRAIDWIGNLFRVIGDKIVFWE